MPGFMWWPGQIPAGAKYDEMMSHIDCWATLAKMVGLNPPPHGEMDGQQRQADLFRQHRQQRLHPRQSKAFRPEIMDLHRWREFHGCRVPTSPVTPRNPGSRSRGNTCGPPRTRGSALQQNLGAIGATYNLTMDPFEKYDMTFNGAVASRLPQSSPGRYAGQDNGWALALILWSLMAFDKSIVNIRTSERFPEGPRTTSVPNLQEPNNPVPYADTDKHPKVNGAGGGWSRLGLEEDGRCGRCAIAAPASLRPSSLKKGHPMHPAIMAIAVSTQLLTPISDAIPKLNVEATCKGSVEADKAMGLALPQSFDKCMSDENSARQQLAPIWSSYSPAVRAQCEGEATIADASYVDL